MKENTIQYKRRQIEDKLNFKIAQEHTPLKFDHPNQDINEFY